MKPANIALCGKGTLACRATGYVHDLTAALLPGWRLVAVPVASDGGKDSWEPSLRAECRRRGIAVAESVAACGLGPRDLLFSLQYDRIIRLGDLNGARAFNLHFSPLPKYRGCYPSVWPLRNGELRSGVTLHALTAGIDDGAIVDQQLFDLPPFLTAHALYRLYHAHGYEVFKRNLEAIVAGCERVVAQREEDATYYDRKSVDFAQREVDPATMTAQACVDFLRSLVFEPFQLPLVAGQPVAAAERVHWPLDKEALARLPAVMQRTGATALFRCLDGVVRVSFADSAQDTRSASGCEIAPERARQEGGEEHGN